MFELLRCNPRCSAIGVEVTAGLSRTANKAIALDHDLTERAQVVNADIRDPALDLSKVTVCVIFFVAYGLEAIWPTLMQRLPEGARIFTLLYAAPHVLALKEHDGRSVFEYVAQPLIEARAPAGPKGATSVSMTEERQAEVKMPPTAPAYLVTGV